MTAYLLCVGLVLATMAAAVLVSAAWLARQERRR